MDSLVQLCAGLHIKLALQLLLGGALLELTVSVVQIITRRLLTVCLEMVDWLVTSLLTSLSSTLPITPSALSSKHPFSRSNLVPLPLHLSTSLASPSPPAPLLISPSLPSASTPSQPSPPQQGHWHSAGPALTRTQRWCQRTNGQALRVIQSVPAVSP